MRTRTPITALALAALAGGAHAQTAWNNPSGGDWNTASNWNPADVPNTGAESALIALGGAYDVTVGSTITVMSLSVTNPDARVLIAGGVPMTMQSLFTDGEVIVNDSGSIFDGRLIVNTTSVIGGAGFITLNALSDTGNFNDAQITAPPGVSVTINPLLTVRGNGAFTGSGSFVNEGTVLAQDPVGPGIQFNTTFAQTGTGQIHADGGFVRFGSAAVVTGGTVTTSNGGVADISTTATFAGVTNTGDLGVLSSSTLRLLGALTNNADLTINRDGAVFNAVLRFDENTAVDGTGQIILRSTSATDDAQITSSAGFTGTIGAGQTVRGAGRLGGSLILDGLVLGDDPVRPIELTGTISGPGELRGAPGPGVHLASATVSGLTFGSAGGTVVAATGTSFVDGITISGEAGVLGSGTRMALTGDVTNNGVLTLNIDADIFNAYLRFDTDATVGGVGEIRMVSPTSTNDAQIDTLSGMTGTIGIGQTVRGAGQLRGTLELLGTAVADDPAFPMEVHGDLSGTGTLRAENNAVLGFVGSSSVHGLTIDTTPGGFVAALSGSPTVGGLTILGDAGIAGGNTVMKIDGPVTNNGRIVINYDDNIFNATLLFDADTTIGGAGEIRMVSPTSTNDAQINTAAGVTGTFGPSMTVAGAGEIRGMLVNNGTIRGDDDAFPLLLLGTITGSGTIRADDATTALSNASITGQTFASSGTGVVAGSAGTSTVTDCINTGDLGVLGSGATLAIASALTNDGTMIVNADENIFNATMLITTPAEIGGTGAFELRLGSGDLGDATLRAEAGVAATFGPGQTVTGSGRLRGDMTVLGTLDPAGLARQLDQAEGVLTLGPSATTHFDLGGLNPGEFDRVTIGGSGSVLLDGEIAIALDAGFVPVRGDSWDVFTGPTTGTFDTFDFPPPPFGSAYRVFYEPGRVFVRLTCSADFDGDNQLNFFDVSTYINLYNTQDPRADLASPFGVFNFFDIAAFINNFNAGCP